MSTPPIGIGGDNGSNRPTGRRPSIKLGSPKVNLKIAAAAVIGSTRLSNSKPPPPKTPPPAIATAKDPDDAVDGAYQRTVEEAEAKARRNKELMMEKRAAENVAKREKAKKDAEERRERMKAYGRQKPRTGGRSKSPTPRTKSPSPAENEATELTEVTVVTNEGAEEKRRSDKAYQRRIEEAQAEADRRNEEIRQKRAAENAAKREKNRKAAAARKELVESAAARSQAGNCKSRSHNTTYITASNSSIMGHDMLMQEDDMNLASWGKTKVSKWVEKIMGEYAYVYGSSQLITKMAYMFIHCDICGADLGDLSVDDLTNMSTEYNDYLRREGFEEEKMVHLPVGKKKLIVRAIQKNLELDRRQNAFDRPRKPFEECELQVEVKNIWDVSVSLQTFKCELKIKVRWEVDKMDSHLIEGLNPEAVNWEPAKYPTIEIFGQVDEFLERKSTFRVSREVVEGTGRNGRKTEHRFKVEAVYTIFAGISENFDLHDFPFDLQNLNIRISVIDRNNVRVEKEGGNTSSKTQFMKIRKLTHWTGGGGMGRGQSTAMTFNKDGNRMRHHTISMGGGEGEGEKEEEEEEGETVEVPFVTLNEEKSDQLPEYALDGHISHVYKIYILGAITMVVVFGWTINYKQSADRLNMDVTLLLVSVAFKHATTGMLPPISYSTEMDRFVIKSFIFIVAATFFHALISVMDTWTADGTESEERLEIVKNVDMILLGVWLVSWTGYVTLRRQTWRDIRAEHNGQRILEQIRDSKWETSGRGRKLREFMDGEIEFEELHTEWAKEKEERRRRRRRRRRRIEGQNGAEGGAGEGGGEREGRFARSMSAFQSTTLGFGKALKRIDSSSNRMKKNYRRKSNS
ncbi:hypothetical protein TrRE_jg13265 [Triparma retinervis]|uniref:Neurotransmitter-gated ion-channel ligand-binding domain-containing protein n=1 Tax=Triparma retinervis TaxID=2557542 RepID=A0A9W7CEP6_9STRA|nr:hypothetical protein TrRE_jg13265 [Triparma retinervis]